MDMDNATESIEDRDSKLYQYLNPNSQLNPLQYSGFNPNRKKDSLALINLPKTTKGH